MTTTTVRSAAHQRTAPVSCARIGIYVSLFPRTKRARFLALHAVRGNETLPSFNAKSFISNVQYRRTTDMDGKPVGRDRTRDYTQIVFWVLYFVVVFLAIFAWVDVLVTR